MKNLIIIIGTVLLGAIIFNMMVGEGDNSLKRVTRDVMMETIEIYERLDNHN